MAQVKEERQEMDGPMDEKRARSRSPINRRSSGKDALLKMLIPDSCVGAVIGKGGANVKDLNQKYKARLNISKPGVLYPTMRDRIALISGDSVDEIIGLAKFVVEKVLEEGKSTGGGRGKGDEEVIKLIVPNTTAGLVIGKNGQEIKNLNDETRAKVIIRSQRESPVDGERVLVITGDVDARDAALTRLIELVAPDEINVRHNGKMDYAKRDDRDRRDDGGRDRRDDRRDDRDRRDNRNGGFDDRGNDFGLSSLLANPAPNQLQALLQQHQPPVNPLSNLGGNLRPGSVNVMGELKTSATINLEVPSIVINRVSSSELSDFMNFSGAQIDASNRGNGSACMITIFGSLEQVQAGYILVGQRIHSIVQQLTADAQRGMKRERDY